MQPGNNPYPTFQGYRAAWRDAFQSDPPVPLNVDIELASLCNLACPFCFWGEADFNEEMLKHSDDGRPKKRLMPTELAMKIIDQAAEIGVPALKFNWRGESTLHPDYSKILTHASSIRRHWKIGVHPTSSTCDGDNPDGFPCDSAFHELLVNTNANCKDHALDGLMAATKVMISLDSVVPATYAKMRVNGRLERALEVARELILRGHPNLWVRRVITKESGHEPFAQQVHEALGGKGYQVSEHHCVDRGDSKHAVNNPELYERTYCGYPSQRVMVAADGLCYPCCVDTDATMPMGDIKKQGLLEIWEDLPFKKLRTELRANEFCSGICKKCESWLAYKAPQRENVQDKAVGV